MVELGVGITGRNHSTDLKNRILANVPGILAYKHGRDVLLSFNDDVGNALRDACLDDCDDEAICLAKAAQIIRRDMTGVQTDFNGSSFPQGSQEEAVPKSLVALVSMILDGPNITRREGDDSRQATLSIAQLLQYNSSAKRRSKSASFHHRKSRETLLPVYLGMMKHGNEN
ncbi:tyrosine-protein kinase receptor tie-1 [Plakobranchus ocellatus]|uniref:Tyrosine-protein kinase receptor tie-1 n=1 Tax=Plakobranchus ocellatus TaxID=259542 RepID=A0AAV4BYB5_9GAST|nr:tyrosine-protein kinase receptor tie-1 [Plakobranchus ocellatus]